MKAPVAIVNFMQYEGREWGKMAAGGTLAMPPVAVFSVFVRRYLVRGLTAGGVRNRDRRLVYGRRGRPSWLKMALS